MKNSIPLSPKHGLNPTIPVCAWCGEPKNEIALMGRMSHKKTVKTAWGGQSTVIEDGDMKAPMYCVLNYEPCEHCKEQWDKGVPVIEVTATTPVPYRPAIRKEANKDIYPTMRMVVLKIETAEELFNNFELKLGIPILLEDEAFEHIFGGVFSGDK